MSAKQQLRKTYLAKRMELSPATYAEGNQRLLGHFKTINLAGIRYIHIFLPMPERREPDTFLIIDWLKQTYPHIKHVFPNTDFVKLSMQHYLDDDTLEIDTNDYGLPEPVKGTLVPTSEIDMVIVPLLAFDVNGYRVGYGKGFYDRFMADCKPGTQFIGLSFFGPVDAIDIDGFDIALHRCITPEKVWVFDV